MPESVHETSVSALLPGVTEECRQIRLAPPSGAGLVKIEPWSTFLSRDGGSRIFQDMNVFDILDVVFGSYARRGGIVPAWRFEIAEPTVYAKRSFTRQYRESDLAFVERLMREEGLIYSSNTAAMHPASRSAPIRWSSSIPNAPACLRDKKPLTLALEIADVRTTCRFDHVFDEEHHHEPIRYPHAA